MATHTQSEARFVVKYWRLRVLDSLLWSLSNGDYFWLVRFCLLAQWNTSIIHLENSLSHLFIAASWLNSLFLRGFWKVKHYYRRPYCPWFNLTTNWTEEPLVDGYKCYKYQMIPGNGTCSHFVGFAFITIFLPANIPLTLNLTPLLICAPSERRFRS